jgi:hypothetical protein
MNAEQNSQSIVRSGVEERVYLLRRAEDHRLLAEMSDEQGARSIHQRLRRLYQERAAAVAMVLPD